MSPVGPENGPNPLAAGALNRACQRRADVDWLAARFANPDSRVMPVWRSRNLLTTGDAPRAVLLPGGLLDRPAGDAVGPLFLGLDGDTAVFALDVSEVEDPAGALPLDGREFCDLHVMGALLSQTDGALCAYARGLTSWHRRQLYCGACGSPTTSDDGGHIRRCTDASCGQPHFPRTDPAIIVLVTDGGDRCLLGRQEEWPSKVYSTLAGFVEPGESLREAVAREVFEETGTTLESADYHSSQPWPFPTSLMLGFRATARRGPVRIDRRELEDARWFERDQLAEAVASEEVRLPRGFSIARRLIEEWLREG